MTTSDVKNLNSAQSELMQKEAITPEDQSGDLLVRKEFLRSEFLELLTVMFCALFATILMIYLDAFEKLFKFSRPLERYQFDEIAVFLSSFMTIGFALFAYRRIQKLEFEIINRRRLEKKLQESQEKYKNLSITDDLTRLFNSRYFYKKLEEEIDRVMRYKQPLSLLLVDLDDFKNINDKYGHLIGDKVLKMAGRVIKDFLRKTDTAYRYGGEEFTVLLPETEVEAAMNVAERIRQGFETQDLSLIINENLHISVSIGAAQFQPGELMEAFVKRADDALYVAKQKGKNRVYLAP